MTDVKITGDNIFKHFDILGKYIPEVALEMMSKAGNEVRESQRKALRGSRKVYVTTKENIATREQFLTKSSVGLEFGHRERLNKTASPESMASFITSFTMERSMVTVVNGSHPNFYPVLRRDGEIVGIGRRVGATSKQTHAILQRMNDDSELSAYPTKKKLFDGSIGTHYAQKGNARANSKVLYYLNELYIQAMERVQNRHKAKM